jgi:ankyrin repeat protein
MNELDRAGRSRLHYAALEGSLAAVMELLNDGFDVDLGDVDGYTPLHFAAQGYHEDVARHLIDHGATVDAQNRFGNTPLWVALFNSRGRPEVIKLLRDAGADTALKNHSGNSPADLARMVANYPLAEILFGD